MRSRRRLKIVTLVLALLLIAVGIVVLQPNWSLTLLARRFPGVVYFVETKQPLVALTIDDGPDPISTPKILDLLQQFNGKATFFVITSHLPGNRTLVRRLVAEGHRLANHLTTDEASILLNSIEFERRLLEAHAVLSRFSKVCWFQTRIRLVH